MSDEKEIENEELKKIDEEMMKDYWELYPLTPVMDDLDKEDDTDIVKEFECVGTFGVGSNKYQTSDDIPVYETTKEVITSKVSAFVAFVLVGVTPNRKSLAYTEVFGEVPDEEFGGEFAIIPTHTPDGTLFIAKSPIIYDTDEEHAKETAILMARDTAKKVVERWQMQVEILVDKLKEETVDL